jgi:hypothetical protein
MPRWSFDLVTRSGPRVITPRHGKQPSESAVRGGADQISLKADRRSAPLVRQGRDCRINFLDCRLSAAYVRDMFYSGPREGCVFQGSDARYQGSEIDEAWVLRMRRGVNKMTTNDDK